MALCPIMTLVLAHLVLGEQMGMWQALGALLSLLGMVVIVAHGDLAALISLQLNPGELWIVGSALCWGLYTVLLRLKFDIELLPHGGSAARPRRAGRTALLCLGAGA